MTEKISIKDLISEFMQMADRGTLLLDHASPEDFFIQIIGVISKVAMESKN